MGGNEEEMKGNKGEWSEVYVFLRLLGEGNLYAADSFLKKMNVYYPIIKVIEENYEYSKKRYAEKNYVEIIDGNTGKTVLKLPAKKFYTHAMELLNNLRTKKGGTLSFPKIEQFLQNIKRTNIKKSQGKPDITLVIHDFVTGYEPEVTFSIKSKLGGSSTLLNASRKTNFIFNIHRICSSTNMIKSVNSIEKGKKIRERLNKIRDEGGIFEFNDTEGKIFKLNMQVIDSNLPMIMANMVLNYYKGKAVNVMDLLEEVKKENPCDFNQEFGHDFYSYKVKSFLTDVALGMIPSKSWNGHYDANGGYIVVQEDGEILCYHVYNKNDFEDYLLSNTKFETPSSKRHDFGYLDIDKNGNLFFKLNLQIRFK